MGKIVNKRDRTTSEDDRLEIEVVICARIRAAVSSGDLPPGTKLPEEALADSFSANRSQVRTAFQRLAFEGLLDLQKNRGAFVSRPTVREAQEVFEARRVIERVTTEIVTRTILTPQLNALRRQIDDQKALWAHANGPAAIHGISGFHLSLAALAHNGALTTALERLIIRTSLILGLYGTARTFATLPPYYEVLMDVIESGQSLVAARQIERCLFALEGELDFYPPLRREVDLKRLMRTIG